jgi:hypothetical protein
MIVAIIAHIRKGGIIRRDTGIDDANDNPLAHCTRKSTGFTAVPNTGRADESRAGIGLRLTVDIRLHGDNLSRLSMRFAPSQ